MKPKPKLRDELWLYQVILFNYRTEQTVERWIAANNINEALSLSQEFYNAEDSDGLIIEVHGILEMPGSLLVVREVT